MWLLTTHKKSVKKEEYGVYRKLISPSNSKSNKFFSKFLLKGGEIQMNKKFWFTLIAIFVMASMLLAACGGGTTTEAPAEEEAPMEEAPTAEEPMEEAPAEQQPEVSEQESAMEDVYADVDPSGQVVTFWHQHSGDRDTYLQQMVEDFNANNEWGITVVAEYQGSYGDIFNKMLTFMNTEDAPNLVVAYQNQAATYQLADALIDMDELVYSAKWGLTKEEIDDFFPGFFYQDIFPSFNNMRLGFPPNRSMEVMYYNQDWLAELGYDGPPTTPDEFKEMACAAAAQPFSGATSEGSMGYQLSIDASRFASWTFAFGGDVFDSDTAQYTYDSPEAIAAWEFLQGLFDDGCASIVVESYGDQTDFGQGRLLFTVGSSSGLPYYQSAVEEGANFEWSVAAIPHTTEEPVQNIYGASVSIPKTSPEAQLAAWLFLKHYTSPEIQAEWAKVSGYFPVRFSVADGLSDYFDSYPAYKTAFEMLQYGTFEPPTPGYDFVREMVEEGMAAIADGADVSSTLVQVNSDANESLAEQMAMIPESPDPWADVDPSGQTVTFWHQHSGDRETALAEIVDEFNQTNKWGITVEAEYQGGYGDIFNKMLTVLNTEDAPDLVVAYQNQSLTYQQADALVDMTSLVDSIKWGLTRADQADFFSGFYNQDIFPTMDNQRLGFPPNRSMEVVYYNQDWLAELYAAGAIDFEGPPQTPEQFKAAACAAVANPFSASTTDISMGYELSIDASRFASWTFAFGGDVFDYDTTQYSYNNEAAVTAMSYLQDLFNEGCATIVVESYGDQTDFGQGGLLFTVGSTSGLPYYQSAIDEGAQFNWSVAAIPHTTEEPVQNIYGASVSMPKHSPESELATWLFIKYYTSPEVQAKWAQVSGYFPVRASAADGLTDFFEATPQYKAGFDMLQYGTTEPAVPGYDFVREIVEEAMAAVAEGADVQATLDQLNEDANVSLAEQLQQ
jgi:multiple sugar transport system substrate-binding protein/sn-glycerol 3-phosphate transport system substrate-binding protein